MSGQAELAAAVLAGRTGVRMPRDSAPGQVCEVRFVPGLGWRGTCPDFAYRQRQCKHITRLRGRLAELMPSSLRAG